MAISPFSTLLSSTFMVGLGVAASCCGAAPVVVALAGVTGGIGASGIYDRLKQVKRDRDDQAAIRGNHHLANLISTAVKSVFDEIVREKELDPATINCLKILQQAKLKIPVDQIDETELPNLFAGAADKNGEVNFGKIALLNVELWRRILIRWLRENKTATNGKDDQTHICERLQNRTASWIADHLKQDFAQEGEGRAFAALQLMFFARLTSGLDALSAQLEKRSDTVDIAIAEFKKRNSTEHQSLVRKLKRWLEQIDQVEQKRHAKTWLLIDDSLRLAGIHLGKLEVKIDEIKSSTERIEHTTTSINESSERLSGKLDRVLAEQANAAEIFRNHDGKLDELSRTIQNFNEPLDGQIPSHHFEFPTELDEVEDEQLFEYCLKVVQPLYSQDLSDSSLAASVLAPRLETSVARKFLEPRLTDGAAESPTYYAVDQLLAAEAKTLIVAQPGMGKSTYLRRLADSAIRKRLLPIIVDLREYIIPTNESQREPWEYSAEKIIKLFAQAGCKLSRQRLVSLLSSWVRSGKLFAAIDSIDEARTDTFIHFLGEQIHNFKSPVVMTCRFLDFRESLVNLGLNEIQMKRDKQEFIDFINLAFPDMDPMVCESIVNHELAATPMGLQLLLLGILRGSTPTQLSPDEKLQFTQEMKEQRSSIHLRQSAEFLIRPSSEKSGLSSPPETIRKIPDDVLIYVAQVIALHYLIRSASDGKLSQSDARVLIRECMLEHKIACTAEAIIDFFKDRNLINVGYADDVWFLHDFLAQALANSLKTSSIEHSENIETFVRFDIETVKRQIADMHGNQIQRMRALFFKLTHRGAIKDVFRQMEAIPDTVWSERTSDGQTLNLEGATSSLLKFSQVVVSIVDRFRTGHREANNSAGRFVQLEQAIYRLIELAQVLPQKGRRSTARIFEDPRNILFCEYLIGLGFFETIGILSELFLESIEIPSHRNYKKSMSYAEGLQLAFEAQLAASNQIQGLGGGPPGKTWEMLANFYRNSIPESTKAALDRAIGIRYIPLQRVLMSISQMLHWDGWGGNGQTCDFVFKEHENSLSKVLANQKRHAIDWHGVREAKNANPDSNFSMRHRLFGEIAGKLKDFAAHCGAAIVTSTALGAQQNQFTIWGDAVGPSFKAERDLVDAIRNMVPRNTNPSFSLTLSEMSGPSINRIFDEIENYNKENQNPDVEFSVYHRDLNLEFSGEPATRKSGSSAYFNQFDAYSCAIALHQVADQTLGHGRVREILGFATHVVRPGGLISIPDVGFGVNLQAFLIPINLVDREGGWGLDVFSKAKNREALCKFHDVASPSVGPDNDRLKVPLPLVDLATGTPYRVAKTGFAMYEFIPYLVIELHQSEVEQLQLDWNAARSVGDLGAVAKIYVQKWNAGAGDWLQEIANKLQEYEKAHMICPQIYKARFG